jgi:hypothetical protein
MVFLVWRGKKEAITDALDEGGFLRSTYLKCMEGNYVIIIY